MHLSCVLSIALLCLSANVFALSAYPKNLIEHSRSLNLSSDEQWLSLVYYNVSGLTKRVKSEVPDEEFFNAKDGYTNPKAELEATIAALFDEDLSEQHAQCRFPARLFWLSEKLGIDSNKLPKPDCLQFTKWVGEANAIGATLIFPAAYINSPSSMFGHTLLRLDQDNDNSLLAYSVNSAATVSPTDNDFQYIYKGLFGGYPGNTTIVPYYMKLKDYRDMESRDIWEYKLNLTQKETDQLVRHVWELHSIEFDYAFFSMNCSYRLIAMLDTVRSNLNMRSEFNIYAIPIDTLRSAQDNGLIDSVEFRPSIATKLESMLSHLSVSERDLVHSLVQEKDIIPYQEKLNTLSETRLNAVLETAYIYSRMARIKEHKAADRSLKLLQLRKDHKAGESLPAPETPKFLPEEGHFSGRARFSMGVRGDENYLELKFRPAYHDLTDPSKSFHEGSEIKFFEGSLRQYENGDTEIEDITLVGIKSLTRRNRFFNPSSWTFNLGGEQVQTHSKRVFVSHIAGGVGRSYELVGGLFYSLVNGRIKLSDAYTDYHDINLGLATGYLWRNAYTQINIEAVVSDSVVTNYAVEYGVSYNQVININNRWAASVNLQRENRLDVFENDFRLGVHYYF